MASWKCGRCGLFNFVESATCRRCGTEGNAAAPPSYHASGYLPQPPQPYNSHYGGQPTYEQQGQWNPGQANAAGTPQQGPVAPLTSPPPRPDVPPQGWAQAP